MTDGLSYAVHAYAWTSSWSSDDLPLVDHAAELGLDAIEIPLMELEKVDPAAIADRVRGAGIGVVTSTVVDAAHDPSAEDAAVRAAGRGYLLACVEAAAAMGAPVMTGVTYSAMGGRLDRRPTRDDMERSAEVLRGVAERAQELGVVLGVEAVNRYETYLVNTAAQALELVELIDHPAAAVHLDAYHMNLEETSFETATASVVDRLCHYHLSESHRGTPGTGTVDWAGIMRALVAGGYRGYVGLEAFEEISDAMRSGTCIWRDLAPSSDELVRDGLAFLKGLEARTREELATAAG
ncbi:sugar phosphate isomerase/epimerase family protein [Patulibacter sp. S7RM1-6]